MVRQFVWAAVACTVAACASPEMPVSCADISGNYRNAGDTADTPLASVLFQAGSGAKTVSISRDANARDFMVVAGAKQDVLRQDQDFTCIRQGLALNRTSSTSNALPPLASSQETTSYTLQKAADGALIAHRSVKTSAVAYGVPFAGPPHEAADVRWQPAAER